MTIEEISNSIDGIHATSLKAIGRKDVSDYMSIFSNDLTYAQSNGKVIDKKRLAKDQENYFSRIKSIESDYKRIECKYESNLYSETLIQKAKISVQVFIFFKKDWNIERKSVYRWSHINEEWKIMSVNILEEKIY